MKIFKAAPVAALLLLVPALGSANCDLPTDRGTDATVRQGVTTAAALLSAARAEHGVPGLSVSVRHRDRGELWSAGLGEAWVETATCMAPGSVLPLGSVSKLVTAAVTARLAEREVIDVDADVRELVPAAASLPDKVTVRQLLGHLGGIRHYERKDFDLAQPGGIIDLRLYPDTATALAIFVEDPPVAAPGAKYHYSTFAYTLLAAALEAAAGKPFLDLVADEVAGPLGLASLQGETLRGIIPERAGRYEREQDGTLARAWPANVAYKWAGGGLVATADDMARFGLAHATPGYLAAETLEAMMTPQATADGESTGVGWAWRIGTDEAGRTVWHHAGAIGGGRAILVVWPEHGLAVSMMSNLSRTPGNAREIAQEIGGAFLARQAP